MGQRLQENNEDLADSYEHLDLLEQQNMLFKLDAEKYQRQAKTNGLIGFAFAGVGFGVGTPLFIEGIRTDNQTMLWAGAGSIAISGAVWAVGHYLFQWW